MKTPIRSGEYFMRIYNRESIDDQLRSRLQKFVETAFNTESRSKLSNRTNYSKDAEYSLDDLLFKKSRLHGWIGIETADGQVVCGSGYYFIGDIMIGGVRLLTLPDSDNRHKYLHSGYILPRQLELAKEAGSRALVLTVDERHDRPWRLALHLREFTPTGSDEKYVNTSRFFSQLEFHHESISFNHCQQKIMYIPIKDFNPSELDGYV